MVLKREDHQKKTRKKMVKRNKYQKLSDLQEKYWKKNAIVKEDKSAIVSNNDTSKVSKKNSPILFYNRG